MTIETDIVASAQKMLQDQHAKALALDAAHTRLETVLREQLTAEREAHAKTRAAADDVIATYEAWLSPDGGLEDSALLEMAIRRYRKLPPLAPGDAAPAVPAGPACDPPPPGAPAPDDDDHRLCDGEFVPDELEADGVTVAVHSHGPVRWSTLNNRVVVHRVRGLWCAECRANDGVRVIASVDGHPNPQLALNALAVSAGRETWRTLRRQQGLTTDAPDDDTITVRGVTVRRYDRQTWIGRTPRGSGVRCEADACDACGVLAWSATLEEPCAVTLTHDLAYLTPGEALDALAAATTEDDWR